MINNDGKLLVFENFTADWTLPKYKPKEKRQTKYQSTNMSEDSFEESKNENDTVNFSESQGVMVTNAGALVQVTSTSGVPQKVRRGFWTWLASLFKSKPPAPPQPTMTVEAFFTSVKNSAAELEVVKERAAGYEKAMVNAKQSGQQALFEKLEAGLNAHRQETQLFAIGMTKYVSEEDIVRFYKESPKGLRLDWVRNFTRAIPEGVVTKKIRADELGVFDNYVVLHYDPQSKSFAETNRERAARRDPILFGLMKDRRVLYFVGDWVDEVCDLTLDQLADKIGKDAIKTLT
jgi:hypothetical protein